MPRFRKESLIVLPSYFEIRKVHFPWTQVSKWKWIWLQDVHKLVIIPDTRMLSLAESYDPMIIRHVRTFYRFDMSALLVDYSTCSHSGKIGDYSTLWNPSRILKTKFDTLACNLWNLSDICIKTRTAESKSQGSPFWGHFGEPWLSKFLNCIATSLFTYEEIPYCYKCDLNDVSLIIYSSVVRGAL